MPRSPEQQGRFALRVDRLFDGRDVVQGRPLLVVEDGRIVAVDASGATPASDLPVVDLPGTTLLPGLVDTHTHLAFDATPEVVEHVRELSDDELLGHMRAVADRMLAVGITTVRDLGDRGYLTLDLRSQTALDPGAGPRIVAAGPPITRTNGHCWFLGCQADTTEELVAAVQEHADRGVDVIKVMATGGRMTPTSQPHESQYAQDALRTVVRAAHARGLPVAAHAHGRDGILDALEAGATTLEHVSFMTADGVEPDQRVIDRIAESGRIASITAGSAPGAVVPPPMAPLMPLLAANMVNLVRSGVRISLGPDGGIAPVKPHDVLPYGVADLVHAGVSTLEALTAATATGAEACGTEGVNGRLLPGLDADLLVVRGDPTTDIAALRQVERVYRRGVDVTRVSA